MLFYLVRELVSRDSLGGEINRENRRKKVSILFLLKNAYEYAVHMMHIRVLFFVPLITHKVPTLIALEYRKHANQTVAHQLVHYFNSFERSHACTAQIVVRK